MTIKINRIKNDYSGLFRTIDYTHSSLEYREALEFSKTIPESVWNRMSTELFRDKISTDSKDLRIGLLSADKFEKEQIFYHGEQKIKPVKNYIYDNNVICEELGDGLYISPSKKVAAFWADLCGKIFYLKLNTTKIAEVNQAQIVSVLDTITKSVEGLSDNLTGQKLNLIIRMLFQKNGYDAAYSSKSISNSFENAGEFFDTAIGANEEQIAVYNRKVLEIIPKTNSECIKNQLIQIKSYLQYPFNLWKFYNKKH